MEEYKSVKTEPIIVVPDTKTSCRSRFGFFHYPKGVYFCLGNEFSERFSFYGMRAVLTLYLLSQHQLSESAAKFVFHAFICLVYFSPLFGSILADGVFGRFKVILYVSILYCIGHVFLTLGSIPMGISETIMHTVDYVGLIIIAIATGGIKPCVSSFAADQFPSSMVEERKQFFSFFYFSVNAGALVSTLITPIFRGKVGCFGQSTCYPLAFGIPSIAMFLAFLIFLSGSPFYKKSIVKDNILLQVVKCIWFGLKEKFLRDGNQLGKMTKRSQGDHWLDVSIDRFGNELVQDVKSVLAIMGLFIPIIFFWALFDQQGSTWVLQANRMNWRLGDFSVLPDQISAMNPLLVIILIPIFEIFIYPLLAKCGILIRPLQRMGTGGILAALSFFVAGFLQMQINKTMVVLPEPEMTRSTVIFEHPGCKVDIGNFTFGSTFETIDIAGNVSLGTLICNGKSININENSLKEFKNLWISLKPGKEAMILLFDHDGFLKSFIYPMEKTKNGKSNLYVMAYQNLSMTLINNQTKRLLVSRKQHESISIDLNKFDKNPLILESGRYQIKLETCQNSSLCELKELEPIIAESGAANFLVINRTDIQLFNLIQPNLIHVFWQFPQYLLVTIAEILVSISGLEFSYSQASKSMKSVLAAVWLMTVSLGNIIDMAVSGSSIVKNPAIEFFVYAIMMGVVTLIFIFLASRYKYVDHDNINTMISSEVASSKDTSSNNTEMIPMNNNNN